SPSKIIRITITLSKLASFALVASATLSSWAQINTYNLEEVIKTSMARFDVPAMAVAVVQDDQVVFAKGFVVSNLNTN
ncbi:hypothetical protein V6237_20010, partial [Pseudoalteromonas carrageenovora]